MNGLQPDKTHFAWATQTDSEPPLRRSQHVKTTFVIGLPRSGTTLLGYLLAGGDRILFLSEPFLSHAICRHRLLHWIYFPKIKGRRLSPPRKCDENGLMTYLKDFARTTGFPFLIIKETYRLGPVLENATLLDRLATSSNPVVGIARHPYDTAISTIRIFRQWRGLAGNRLRILVPGMPRLDDDREVVEWFAQNWLSFAHLCKRNQTFIIRYEDLVRNPASRLQELCEHCGLPFDQKMLDNRHPRFAGGIGDRGVLMLLPKPLNQDPIGRGKQLAPEFREIINTKCADAAAELDYSL